MHKTSILGIFAAGDMHRGQSFIAWTVAWTVRKAASVSV